jgi:hypothetical protein
VAAFFLFHLGGIALLLNIGMFPYVCAAAWLAFIPSAFWNRTQQMFSGIACSAHSRAISVSSGAAPPPPESGQATRISAITALLITSYVVTYNIAMFKPPPESKHRPHWFWMIGRVTGLSQNWQLFAPYVNTRDGWFVGVANLSDGSTVDPIRGGKKVSWQKPEWLSSEYRSKRWRRFLLNLYHSRNPKLIESYADYVGREWNRQNPGSVISALEIYFMLQDSQHPEDGAVRVRLYPFLRIGSDGRARFHGDNRRNEEIDARTKKETSEIGSKASSLDSQ